MPTPPRIPPEEATYYSTPLFPSAADSGRIFDLPMATAYLWRGCPCYVLVRRHT